MTDAERIEVLALAYALLDGSTWYRGRAETYALLDGSTWYRGRAENDGAAHCAVTAFSSAFAEKQSGWSAREPEGDYYQLRRLIESGVPGNLDLPDYNDAPGRRKRDVLRLYEKAAARIGK